jgi:hypothetical protein
MNKELVKSKYTCSLFLCFIHFPLHQLDEEQTCVHGDRWQDGG